MFHLFKRVYIEFDDAIDVSVNRIVISEIHGVQMLESLDSVMPGNLLLFTKSMDEIIGAEKQYQSLLNFLEYVDEQYVKLNRKIVIYCDKNTYFNLTTSWLKILLPNITIGSAHNIINSSLFSTRMFGTSYLVPFTRAYRITQTDYNITLEDFSALFSNINIERDIYIPFISKLYDSVSLEFLLASYWYNGSFKEELKTLTKAKLSISMQQWLYETKAFILGNILNTSVMEELKLQKIYDLSNLDEIFTDTALDVWFDSSIWNVKSVGMHHTYSDINFKNITDNQFNKFGEHIGICKLGEVAISLRDAYASESTPRDLLPGLSLDEWISGKLKILKMCILDEITDSDLEFLLDSKTPGSCGTTQIFEWSEIEKYNPFLTIFLRKAMLAGEMNVLRVYSLV